MRCSRLCASQILLRTPPLRRAGRKDEGKTGESGRDEGSTHGWPKGMEDGGEERKRGRMEGRKGREEVKGREEQTKGRE